MYVSGEMAIGANGFRGKRVPTDLECRKAAQCSEATPNTLLKRQQKQITTQLRNAIRNVGPRKAHFSKNLNQDIEERNAVNLTAFKKRGSTTQNSRMKMP